LQRLAASDLGSLDLNASAFIVGATPETRSAVAALVRIGFRRVNLTGTNDKRGEEMLKDFKKTYFNVQFSFTPRSMITQLPGVHSVAVNTLSMNDDPSQLSELFYFNFLKSGAVWIEVPFTTGNSPLIQEARNVGADVRESAQVSARCDQAWAESCFKVRLDCDKLRAQFVKALLPRETD
jgi:shikimate 5-dehydrogenase